MDGPPQVLADRYRLSEAIGRGGMADVWSAEDTRSGRRVAVKVMRVGEAADPERFAAEMAILDRLDHPAIVRLFDTGRTGDDSPFFVMQLVDGESLSVRLREEGPLPAPDIVRIAARVAGALEHAHQRGVVHRDIKPANILIDERGRGYLTDFGVARLVDATMVTRTGTTIGTAAYLAPEQLQDSAVGPSADVYSLGLVLIEAFTGRRAFGGSGVEAAMARLSRDPALPDDLPDNWIGLLLAMTRRDPDRRPTAGFVEGVLRGRIPPPPLDPAEFAARHDAAAGDDAPTAVTPAPAARTSWDPPSGGSGPRVTAPPAPPPPPPREPVTPSAADRARSRRSLAVAVLAGALAGALLLVALLASGVVPGLGDDDPVVGDRPVHEATREVLRVLDAADALGASDPSLQADLQATADRMVDAVNGARWDEALLSTVDMTADVQAGIARLDISQVALDPLLEALSDLAAAVQAEVDAAATEGG
jgi:eukaryotic-like serine/threonine-protein kinase